MRRILAMKKFVILTAIFMLSGCAWMNPLNWWGDDQPSHEVKVGFEPNRFLWQATLDKLAFMNGVENKENSGTITTDWTNINGIEYKVEVRVLSEKLRSDCLQVKVLKRLRNGQQWIDEPQNPQLNRKVEDSILNRARVLYRDSLSLQ